MQAKHGFTTDLHSSLQKPLITQLYLCNSKESIFPSPFPLFSAPCWDQPFAAFLRITHFRTVACSASSCTDVLRIWSWTSVFYWEIWSQDFSLVSLPSI